MTKGLDFFETMKCRLGQQHVNQRCVCGTVALAEVYEVRDSRDPLRLFTQRHLAPCGAVCMCGCANPGPPPDRKEMHSMPWDGHPDTDGHYHGECPKGCFVNCCKPKGNLCGPECQQCYPKEEY